MCVFVCVCVCVCLRACLRVRACVNVRHKPELNCEQEEDSSEVSDFTLNKDFFFILLRVGDNLRMCWATTPAYLRAGKLDLCVCARLSM